jgi:hypothetical protein
LDKRIRRFLVRDAADEDYVAARTAYRIDPTHSFLWNSLQAVEKYTKAILLYNRRPTGDLGHDVRCPEERCLSLTRMLIRDEIEMEPRWVVNLYDLQHAVEEADQVFPHEIVDDHDAGNTQNKHCHGSGDFIERDQSPRANR